MTRLHIAVGCLALGLALAAPHAGAADKDTAKKVTCKDRKFLVDGKEQPLTIKVGESVVWVNEDDVAHTATSDKGSAVEFNEKIPKKGMSKPVKFARAGTFKYHCIPHDDMVGAIVVKE